MKTDKQIDIHIFDMDDLLFQQLFPEENKSIEEKNIGKIENRKNFFKIDKSVEDLNLFIPAFVELFRNKCTITWNAFNYPKLLDNNYKKILTSFYKRINTDENRNNIVIKFSNSYLKDFSTIINKIKKNVPFLLYVLKNDEIKEEEFKYFKLPQYISYTKDCNNYNDKKQKNIFAQTIISYIIEKQTYFFELDSSFKNLFNPKCFIECNILLMGESRAGKSSFINRVFNKLISHEDANLESVTNNSTEYTFKKGNIGIRIIDTPGIIKKSNIKFIKKILDEYFGKIHLIFFFIKAQSNLENCIELLKYIKLKNEKNFKEGKKKIPLLFIKNGEDLVNTKETPPFFKYLKSELKTNNLLELYEDKFNKKANDEENKNNELDEEELFNDNDDDENNYDNYCEGNIIQIHIPTGKNINKIFWISKEYLIENNRYLMDEKDNEFIQMKENTKKLIKFYIKEKLEKNELSTEEKEEKKTLLKTCNDYVEKKKSECSLINSTEILNIKKGNTLKKGIGILTSIILSPLFIASYFLPIFVGYGLLKIFDLFFDEYILSLSIQFGFDDKDLIEYDLKKYLIEKSDEKETKIKDEKESKNIDKNIKESKNIDKNIKEKTNKKGNEINKKEDKENDSKEEIKKIMTDGVEFFEKLLFYIGPIQCLIKWKELSKELFDLFEELINRKEKDWITYQIHKFN